MLKLNSKVVKYLHSIGRITDEDYKRFLLDERGKYKPKLKK